jgi:hypothetical protein
LFAEFASVVDTLLCAAENQVSHRDHSLGTRSAIATAPRDGPLT